MSIENPQAIKFSNEKVRTISDLAMQFKAALTLFNAEWVGQNVAQYFPSGGGQIMDGSETDGRPIIERDDVITMSGNVQTLIANIDAVDTAMQKAAVNPIRG